MNKEYEQELPDWWKDSRYKKEFRTVLTNDIDSYIGCLLLQDKFNWDIGYFFDFERLYSVGKGNAEYDKLWIDCAVKYGYSIDNHLSRFTTHSDSNSKMINPNLIYDISRLQYSYKYGGSTTLLIWSLLNRPLPSTDEGKMLLLTIDSAYKGFYYQDKNLSYIDREHNTIRFRDSSKSVHKHYIKEMLGFDELIELEERKTKEDFIAIDEKYKVNKSKFWCSNGQLQTNIDIESIKKLLEIDIDGKHDADTKLYLLEEYETYKENVKYTTIPKSYFSLAFITRDIVKYSVCSKVHEVEERPKEDKYNLDWLRKFDKIYKNKERKFNYERVY